MCSEAKSLYQLVSALSDCDRVAVKRSVMEIKAMYGITEEHYVVYDNVRPILALHPAVEVRIDIEETGVKLVIRPREYEWPRGCPDACSAMTGFFRPLHGPQRDDL